MADSVQTSTDQTTDGVPPTTSGPSHEMSNGGSVVSNTTPASGSNKREVESGNGIGQAETTAPPVKRRRRRMWGNAKPTEISDENLPSSTSIQADINNLKQQMKAVRSNADIGKPQRDKLLDQLESVISDKRKLLKRAQAKEENQSSTSTENPETLKRRLYVGNLHAEFGEDEIRAIFAPFGNIVQIDMSKDPATGKSQGYCFVEYDAIDAAQTAMNVMNNFEFGTRRLRVERPTSLACAQTDSTGSGGFNLDRIADAATARVIGTAAMPPSSTVVEAPATKSSNPLVASAAAKAAKIASGFTASRMGGGNPNARIYVGSIPFELNKEHVKEIFAPFGYVYSCELLAPTESVPGQYHRGYGFLEFDTEQAATNAIAAMNGFVVAGRQLKVGRATSQA